jgi:transaldolase
MTALGADWWNDSGSPDELDEAVGFGAVGGTSNPVIVMQAIKAHPERYAPVIDRLVKENSMDSEDDIAWRLIQKLAVECASKLSGVYDSTGGTKGFLSVQVSPKHYRNKAHMVAQASILSKLAPNIAIKAPATDVGIAAMEEMVAKGISINATVSFSVAQAVEVAKAIQRGLNRASSAGHDPDKIRTYVTLMVGRVDDHLKRVAEKEGIVVSPGLLDWAGIAVFKEAHKVFSRHGYRGTLLAAAYRHQGHWTELVGTDVLQTIPYSWWSKFNISDYIPETRLELPVDQGILDELAAKFTDFNRAYFEDGMRPEEFVGYGASRNTLQQFLAGYTDLLVEIRNRMIQN